MRSKHRILASMMAVAAAAFVYRAAVSAYFFDDDFQWLVGTWAFQPTRLLDISHRSHFYRPVIEVYFATATPLFGGSPTLFHLANIGLHAANGLLLFALASAISGDSAYAFLAALFFVIQPGDVDAIAWVSALAEAIGAFFGCLALLWFLQFRRSGRSRWHVLSVAAFLVALMTHESSVVFLPLLVLAGWAFASTDSTAAQAQVWTSKLRPYVPYALLTTAYIAIALWINSRNYLVTEGHYGVGVHVIKNALDYISALYVGRGDVANYLLIAVGLTALLLLGNRRVVFETSWLVLALLPFVFFNWSITSRYLYLPAMGFSMLLADGVMQLGRLLPPRLPRAARTAVVALVAMAIAGRFTLFAVAHVKRFAADTEEYRDYITEFKQVHGKLPSHSRVSPDRRLRSQRQHGHRFLNALVQWEYRDPTIELIPDQPSPR